MSAAAELIATSDDTLLGGRVKLRQPIDGYRVAIDPVLLAASVPARAQDRVLDIGWARRREPLPGGARAGLLNCGAGARSRNGAARGGEYRGRRSRDRLSVIEGDLLAPPARSRRAASRR